MVMLNLGHRDRNYFKDAVRQVQVASFQPAEGVKIQTKENEVPVEEETEGDRKLCLAVLDRLPVPSSLAGFRLVPAVFEKVLFILLSLCLHAFF